MSGRLYRAAFPSGPIADDSGNLSSAWRGFFQSLYTRTGGANGISSDTSALEAELEAERQARVAGDVAMASGLAAERTARQAADSTETQARQTGDTNERLARQAADTAETQARIAADALLVPKADLCSLWAACDLGFLPTSDPGLGKPWLDGAHIVVGSGILPVDIGLEDGSGLWTLEGSGDWIWG